MKHIKITVFTPAYNRAYIIEKLYQSLQNQTNRDFEWLVVDDGSTDETEAIFKKWLSEDHSFPIRYYKVANGGKHRAINLGVSLARGDLFFIVDSDDYLTIDAIDLILSWESKLPKDANVKFAGISGAKGYSKEKIIGTGHNQPYVDCTSQQRSNYGMTGDKAEVFYTDILKHFPFPSFEGENFITESIVWFAIGKAGYKMRWYNDIIYIGEYLEDGLSACNMDLFYRNPRGYLLALKSDLEHMNLSLKQKLGRYAVYYKVSNQLGVSKKQVLSELNIKGITLNIAYILKKIKEILQKFFLCY